jgi:heme/copper-type cytochrome/quinol oxidase subunit 2
MTNRFLATLLLTLPSMVAMVPAVAHSGRTIDVTLTRSGMVPEQIAMQVGERVRLQMTSADGKHVCRANGGLRFDAQIPAGGATVMVDVTPTETGMFEIDCNDDGDLARTSAKGRFVVNSKR